MPLILSSSSFQHKSAIPLRHTCDGEDISPQLVWTGAPAATQSLALIVEDPDAPDPQAPTMTWVHWLLYNIPPQTRDLPEGVAVKSLPAGTLQGMNDWRRTGYGGPCPPIGTHRYFHKLFALDARLPDLGIPSKTELEKAMQGHVLAHAELIGLYERRRT
jgi:Raf kinase inhibitor-like YbhB/YbcL family protein